MRQHRSIMVQRLALVFVTLAIQCADAFAATPVPGISVIVKKNPGGIVFSGVTDKNGKFTTLSLSEGSYTITFPKDKNTTAPKSLVLSLMPGNTVTVKSGRSDAGKDIIVNTESLDDTSIRITIGKKGGKIAGTISTMAIKENGTK